MTALFLVLLGVIVVGTALALAGRWRPQGLPDEPPALSTAGEGEQPRFDVVLRGYRMDQVDAELGRLRAMLADQADQPTDPPAAGAGGGPPAVPTEG